MSSENKTILKNVKITIEVESMEIDQNFIDDFMKKRNEDFDFSPVIEKIDGILDSDKKTGFDYQKSWVVLLENGNGTYIPAFPCLFESKIGDFKKKLNKVDENFKNAIMNHFKNSARQYDKLWIKSPYSDWTAIDSHNYLVFDFNTLL